MAERHPVVSDIQIAVGDPITHGKGNSPGGDRFSPAREKELPSRQQSQNSRLDFQLPNVVESLRQGRISTYTLATVLASLFALMEVVFVTAAAPPTTIHQTVRGSTAAKNFFLIASYGAIIFNISAAVSGLLLADFLGPMAFVPSGGNFKRPRSFIENDSGRQLMLRWSGKTKGNILIDWHWYISYNLGIICVFSQLTSYIWLHESNLIGSVLSVALGFAVIPFLLMFTPF